MRPAVTRFSSPLVRFLTLTLCQILLVVAGFVGSGTAQLFNQTDYSATSIGSWYNDNWYQLGTGFSGLLQSLTLRCYTDGGYYPNWGDIYLQEFSDPNYTIQTNNWQLASGSMINPPANTTCGPTSAEITLTGLNINIVPTMYYRLYTLGLEQNVSVTVLGTDSMGWAMYDGFVYGVGRVEYYYTFYPFIIANLPPVLAIQFNPPYIAFPDTGGTAQVVATNSGTVNVDMSAQPSITGYNSGDFVVTSTTCGTGGIIQPQTSCLVNVQFTPTTNSWEAATLLLFDDVGHGLQTVPLTGGGQLASISPNPVAGSDSPQTITITGTNFADGATINWQDLTLSAPQFQWTGSINNPQVISPTMMTVEMTVGDASSAWQIEVVNPGVKAQDINKTSNWFPFQVNGTGAANSTFLDDYPFKNAQFDPTQSKTCSKVDGQATADGYGFCFRECTSYIAWRMNRDTTTADSTNPAFFNGMAGGFWGGAENWGLNAAALHYKSDPNTSPRVGDIAQWSSLNHVAYVENVNSDGSIDVSEYNYGGDEGRIKHQYGVRHITADNFADLDLIHIDRLTLSPSSVDFGNQAVGSSSSQTITVTNSLAETLTLSVTQGASNSGIGTGDFTPSGTCSGASLPPGAQCEIIVTFTPPGSLTKGEKRSAAMILSWGVGPQLAPVKGVALTNLTYSPQSLSFGKIPVGQTSPAKTVKLTNNTGADVEISSITTGSTDFSANSKCGSVLTQGSSCTIGVVFSPSAKGNQSSTLTITDNAIDSPQTLSLKGAGI